MTLQSALGGGNFSEIFEVKVEKFKNYLNKLLEFSIQKFLYFAAIVALYKCTKIHSLSFCNKLSTEVAVLGLSRFLADFSCF